MRTYNLLHVGLIAAALMTVAAFAAKPAHAAAVVGQTVPALIMTDIDGNVVNLSELKGQMIVLEWTNAECPYVKKHYGPKNMQMTQEKATSMGVIWIAVNSSAPGKQGAVSIEEAKALVAEKGIKASHMVLDPSGEIGKSFGAATTPHMYVIDKDGKIAYAGAIDDNSSANPAAVEGAKNYVLAALDDLSQGKPVAVAETSPYGCSVKY